MKYEQQYKHGEAVPETKEYQTWKSIKQRCNNRNCYTYYKYGYVGIRVCTRWQESYENFLADMGRCPTGMSLGRVDNNGDYSPENCRWETVDQQVHNKSNNVWLEYNGERLIQRDWAERLGVSQAAIRKHLKLGRKFEDFARRYSK